MVDFTNDSIADIVAAILEDGKIDDAEVTQFQNRLMADGQIDEEEANALFQINDAVKGQDNSGAWPGLFVDSICCYLLHDETTPGEIDDAEAAWLIGKIEGDGEIDDTEKQLLLRLKGEATKIADSLTAKMQEWGV